MNFEKLFWAALDSDENQVEALRRVVLTLQAEGIDTETILWELQEFNDLAQARSDTDSEAVIEVISLLMGW